MRSDSWKGIAMGVVIGLFVGVFLKGILFFLFLGVVTYLITKSVGKHKNHRSSKFWKNWIVDYLIIAILINILSAFFSKL